MYWAASRSSSTTGEPSPLHTGQPSRIPRPVGHHPTRTSYPKSKCILCGVRAPSTPSRVVSGASYESDVKLFRQQKETGGRRVSLGAVDTNVAGNSASTDKQGTRWPRRIFVPPVVEGSVPSRNPRIAAKIAGLRAVENPGRWWCWGLALGQQKKFCQARGLGSLRYFELRWGRAGEYGYAVRFKSNYVVQPNSVTRQKREVYGRWPHMAADYGIRDIHWGSTFNLGSTTPARRPANFGLIYSGCKYTFHSSMERRAKSVDTMRSRTSFYAPEHTQTLEI
ncbi:hypothetical protein B0H14DRAFT_2603034 [Mycena olivaceomarginata]|nr:hypothetical protein B0H14DRAFT_2603034 [Mycena olivaceomarginata]